MLSIGGRQLRGDALLAIVLLGLLLALISSQIAEASTTHTGRVPYWTGMTHLNPTALNSNQYYDKTRPETARSMSSNVWVTVYCDEGSSFDESLGTMVRARLFARRTLRPIQSWYDDRATTTNGFSSLFLLYTAEVNGYIEPSIATDSNGTWIVIFSAPTLAGDRDIFAIRSISDGATWQGVQLISSTLSEPQDAAFDGDPHLLWEPTSNAWVVAWNSKQTRDSSGGEGDVLVVMSTNRGQNFSTPAFVNSNFASDSFNNDAIQLYSPASGLVEVIYRRPNGNGVTRFYSMRRNLVSMSAWTAEALFCTQDDLTENVREIGVAADLRNNAVVAVYTTDAGQVKSSVSTNGGVSFAPPRILQSNSDVRDPGVGTDSRGVFVAVWTSTQRWYVDTLRLNRTISADRVIFYSVATGQNSTGLGNGWSTPKALDHINIGRSGSVMRPRIFVDAPRRGWIVVYQSSFTTYSQQSGTPSYPTSSTSDGPDFDVFFSMWHQYMKEMCVERSSIIAAHCVEALQDKINALPTGMSSYQNISIAGTFAITNPQVNTISISNGRRVSISAELPGLDSMNQGTGCYAVPFFYINDATSALRFFKTGLSINNSPMLVVNRGGTPASNLEVTFDNTLFSWGSCYPFSSDNRCPIGFRPPISAQGETICVPCPAGSFCTPPFTASAQAQPCPVGSYCGAGSFQPTPCKVFRYYSPAAPAMTSLAECSTTGSPCLPGYRCPPGARTENHTMVVSVDNPNIMETLVFPGERDVSFTLTNVRQISRRLSFTSESSTPPWLGIWQIGGRWDPSRNEFLLLNAQLRSNVPGVSVSDQLTSTFVFNVWDYTEDDQNEYTAPIVITIVRQVTSVIFSPEEGIKSRVALGEPLFSDTVFVFNIGCTDSVSYQTSLWDCGHPNAPPITSSAGNSTLFPVDWVVLTPGSTNGTIAVSSADPAEIKVVMDPSASVLNPTGLLAGRLPAGSNELNKLGREGLFIARACVQVRLLLQQQGIPLIKNVPIEVSMFENCPEGTFSPSGTSEQSSCAPCPMGTYSSSTGTRACTACPESRPRSFLGARSVDECLTAPGYLEDPDGVTLDCLSFGEGVACNSEGIRLERVPLRPGYWRSDNRSKRVMKCLHPQFCVGGDGRRPVNLTSNVNGRRLQLSNDSSNENETIFDGNVNYCYPHHRGALCEGCLPGYVRRGSNVCSECDADSLSADRVRLSWTIIAAVVIVVAAFLVVQRKMIFSFFVKARKTASEFRRGSVNAFSSSVKRASNLGHAALHPTGSKPSTTPVAPSLSPVVTAETSSLQPTDISEVMSPPNKEVSRMAASMDFARRSKGSSVGFVEEDIDSSDNESAAGNRTSRTRKGLSRARPQEGRERSWTRSRVLTASVRMSQRFQVKERASYVYRMVTSVESNTTLRILLSLFQVCAGISTTFVELFPPIYHQAVAVLNVISAQVFYNIDFACILTSNHYVSLVMSMLVPFIAVLLIILGHLIIERRLKKERALHEITRVRNSSFSLFLLVLFLVYPGVSATILSTFACRRFDDGSAYLRKDLTIDCNAPGRSVWVGLAAFGTIVYVVGIPIIYMISLLRVKKYILDTDPMASKEDYESVMFLVEPYRRECYWFEVFELIRKLIQTSLLVFFLDGSVLQTIAMIVVSGCVIIVIYEVKPYKMDQANRLASVAQWCILVIAFLGLLYKIDLVRLDSGFNYDRRTMLDTLVMMALLATPVVAFYQQRKFVLTTATSQYNRYDKLARKYTPKIVKEKMGCCLERPVSNGADGAGYIISTSPKAD